jgi:tetratricopeptide (TPR) repeat protein
MARKKKNKIDEIVEDEVMVDIIESTDHKENFLEKYQDYIVYAAGGLLLLVGLFFAYKYLYLGPKNKEAMQEVARAELMFERDSFRLALENPGDGFMGFLEIIDDYGRTKTGNLARYYAGISYLNTGEFEDAIKYLKRYKHDKLVTAITKFGALGDAYSELNDFGNAKKYYKRAVKQKPNDALTPYYLHKLFMLYRSEGNNEEMVKIFKRMKDEFPASNLTRDTERFVYPPIQD